MYKRQAIGRLYLCNRTRIDTFNCLEMCKFKVGAEGVAQFSEQNVFIVDCDRGFRLPFHYESPICAQPAGVLDEVYRCFLKITARLDFLVLSLFSTEV